MSSTRNNNPQQVSPVAEWHERLLELARMEEGWLDGRGHRVTDEALTVAWRCANALVALGAHRPGIFPTESGGIHFEWIGATGLTSDEGESESFSELLVSRKGRVRFETTCFDEDARKPASPRKMWDL